VQSRWAATSLLYPPFGRKFDQVMDFMRRWL
jgi:coniferyl-aldehyde dehydrogenase